MTHQSLGVLELTLALNLVLGPLWGRSSQIIPTSGIAGRGSFTLSTQGPGIPRPDGPQMHWS